ncbi:MAG: radical SAM protein [Candidatus Lokiarchaeota archaeon]|nr:radical SAM protein [Candidatus Lokiarchaeota archaeon]
MLDKYTAFVKKTEILCKGLYLDENLINHYRNQGIEISYGRKGGAGPLGGRYFLFENHAIVNAALWNDPQKSDFVVKENIDGYFKIYDNQNKIEHSKLKLVQNPNYYSPEYKTTDGIPMKKIALVHGIDCLSSTIYQKCVYQGCGEGCKFCGIELSLENDSTIEEKNHTQMTEVIAAAKKEGRCSHMTLTSGTDESIDKGANRYIELLKGVKNKYPNLPLHIQIEPLEDLSYINELKDAGADTIGIHLEVLDQHIREIITPGKSRMPYDLYVKNWERALEVFGKNQVSSYVLTGFGESPDDFILGTEKVISLGVIPFITPVRSIPGRKDLPTTNPNVMVEIYSKAAKLMKEYGVNPLKSKAGCVRCGGCSSINDAYKSI